MGVRVQKHFFDDMAQALDDIKSSGFWPRFFVSERSPPLDTHWHDCDVHAYVMQDRTWFLDAESGRQLDVTAGDMGGEVETKVVYLIAVPEPVPEGEFLAQHSPDDLQRGGAA